MTTDRERSCPAADRSNGHSPADGEGVDLGQTWRTPRVRDVQARSAVTSSSPGRLVQTVEFTTTRGLKRGWKGCGLYWYYRLAGRSRSTLARPGCSTADSSGNASPGCQEKRMKSRLPGSSTVTVKP